MIGMNAVPWTTCTKAPQGCSARIQGLKQHTATRVLFHEELFGHAAENHANGTGSESIDSTALASAQVFPSPHAAQRLPGDCPEPHTEHRRQKGQKGATTAPNTQLYAL